jgi:hypothetical protein
MASYTFTKTGSEISIDGGSIDFTDPAPSGYKVLADTVNEKVVITSDQGNIRMEINLASDTVTVNEVEFEGTASELNTLLYSDIFASSAGATEVVVYQRKTVLTHAQLLAIQTTPVEIVPAPGADKTLVFHQALFTSKITTEYTLGTNSIGYIAYADGGDAAYLVRSTQILGAAGNRNTLVPPICDVYDGIVTDYTSAYSTSTISNKGFTVWMGNDENQDFTGGDPSNTLEITVFYSIVDL